MNSNSELNIIHPFADKSKILSFKINGVIIYLPVQNSLNLQFPSLY